MERETYTVTTPSGKHNVTLKTYITGREKRSLTNVFLNGDLQFSASGADIKGLKGGLVEQAEDLGFNTVIVSIDGQSANIVETVLNMHAQDYEFIVKEVNKVTSDQIGNEVKKN